LGYNTGAYQGFKHTNSNKGIIKLDWNINDDNNKLAVIYFLNAAKDKPAHPSALDLGGPDANNSIRKSGYQINNELRSVLVELNSK
jgi:hypothetical protein